MMDEMFVCDDYIELNEMFFVDNGNEVHDEIKDNKVIKLEICFGEKKCDTFGLKDTGSSCLAVSRDLAGYLGIKKNKQVSVKVFGGFVLTDCADDLMNNVVINVKNKAFTFDKVFIEDTGYPVILPKEIVEYIYKQQYLEPDYSNNNMILTKKICSMFPNVIAQNRFDIGRCQYEANKIQFKQNELNSFIRYDVKDIIAKQLVNDIQCLIDAGVIVRGRPKYIMNTVPIRKKDGSYRLCIDMRPLNKIVNRKYYCSPKTSFFFENVTDFNFISTIDINQAYLNIPWNAADEHSIGFHLRNNLYIFKRMVFGYVNSPSDWQEIIDMILCESGGIAYQDDILCISKGGLEDHMKMVLNVVKKLHDAGLKINISKCKLAVKEVTFLGRTITSSGVKIADKYLSILDRIETPNSIYKLRAFRGLINYFVEFLPYLSIYEKELNLYIGSTSKHDGKKVCQIPDNILQIVEKVKLAVKNAPLLGHINYNLPFLLFCDASDQGMGAKLAQPTQKNFNFRSPDSRFCKPISFMSKSFKPYRRLTPIIVWELRAIAEALVHFRDLIFGFPIFIYSDHKNLVSIIEKGMDQRYWKYVYTILSFTPVGVYHIPGRCNGTADFLSRYMISEEEEVEMLLIENKQTNEKKEHKNNQNWASEIFQNMHCKHSHLSINKIYPLIIQFLITRVSKKRNIRKILGIIRNLIRNCTTCLLHNEIKRKKLNPTICTRPFEKMSMDMMFFEQKNIIVSVDEFSGYTIAKIIKSQRPQEICEFIERKIINIFGYVDWFHVDNFKSFRSETFTEYMKNIGAKLTYSVPGNHSTNQRVERMNRTLKLMLRKEIQEKGNFIQSLERIMFTLNMSPDDILQLSPNDIIFSYKIKYNKDIAVKGNENLQALESKYLDNIVKKMPTEIYIKDLSANASKKDARNKKVILTKDSLNNKEQRVIRNKHILIPLLKSRWLEATGSSQRTSTSISEERGELE